MSGYSSKSEPLMCTEPPMASTAPPTTSPVASQGNAAANEQMKGGESSFFSDAYGAARKGLDVLGVAEAFSIAKTAKDWIPGSGFTPGADKLLGPLGIATSAIDLVGGGYNLVNGIQNDNSLDVVDGIHDLIGGTAGGLGNVPGPVGAVAKSFGAGFAVGDAIAPLIFGSEEEDNKAKMVDIPEDGKFKPTTGNSWVDAGLDVFGIRD
jgi:hypothetical protein